jgi:KDO2-lipid IV(A) lauroyltransferase
MIPITETESYFEETMAQTCLYILVADQSPSNITKAFWVNFLNQDTPCLHGPEKYAHLYNYPLFFIKIERVKRGHYTVKAELLCENPRLLKSGEVTQLYMEKLEEVIRENPSGWLWSHRRWKRKRPTFMISSPRVEHNPL